MHSASQASSGATGRKDTSYSTSKMDKTSSDKNLLMGKIVLPKPNPKALPDMIEVMVSV